LIIYWKTLPLFVLCLFIYFLVNSDFLKLCLKEGGLFFAFGSVIFHMVLSVVTMFGGVAGLLKNSRQDK
jgi:hypothetical protein